MSTYKVGDVAALFSEPKEPTTESGKKLQSLFSQFHNKKNIPAQSPQNSRSKESKNVENRNEETENQKGSKKNKKRKFSAITNPESNTENSSSEQLKEINKQEVAKSNEKKDNFLVDKDFPRKKKKLSKINAISFDSNSFIESEVNENPFFGNRNKSNDISKSKNKQVSSFIKKSKKQKHAAANDGVGRHNNEKREKMSDNKEAFENDDTLLISEIKDFLKNNGLTESEEVNENSRSDKNEPNVISKSKTSPKGQVSGFIRKSKHQVANVSVGSHDDENSEKMSNTEAFNNSDTLFGSEIDFKRSPKKLKKKKSDANFIQNSKPDYSNLGEQDFIKLPNAKFNDEDKLKRTLFVGNLRIKTVEGKFTVNNMKTDLGNLFSPFGEIQQIRYHGIETDKAKIFSKHPPKSLNRKYAADSIHAFIVFKERQSAVDALSLSGSLFKSHHITVDFALPIGTKKLYDDKRSIFIGNLPFDIKDEIIWDTFTGCGRIEAVRILRDRQSGIGKGFGYVLFSTVQAKENALALENLKIEGRTIRIKAVEYNNKSTQNIPAFKRDSFKSQAIKYKKKNKDSGSRKSITKIIKKQKTLHQKKKIASILQKSMK